MPPSQIWPALIGSAVGGYLYDGWYQAAIAFGVALVALTCCKILFDTPTK